MRAIWIQKGSPLINEWKQNVGLSHITDMSQSDSSKGYKGYCFKHSTSLVLSGQGQCSQWLLPECTNTGKTMSLSEKLKLSLSRWVWSILQRFKLEALTNTVQLVSLELGSHSALPGINSYLLPTIPWSLKIDGDRGNINWNHKRQVFCYLFFLGFFFLSRGKRRWCSLKDRCRLGEFGFLPLKENIIKYLLKA